MNNPHADTDKDDEDQNRTPASLPTTSDNHKQGMSLSMHDGIAVWCDCCSCEAEPYWAALAEELGVDLSDHEEAESTPTR
ncbi:MAG: hypothetical protein ABFR65_11565 [Pseudomonadota bacterium]